MSGAPASTPTRNGVYYIHTDHPSTSLRASLGSTTLVTTGEDRGGLVAGSAWTRQLHAPYGALRHVHAPYGPVPTDYGYTGQRATDLGLLDYRARWYIPALGRFASADTIVPSPGAPQSFNRYSYAANNPCRYNDPSGHCGEPETWGSVSADDLSTCYFGESGHITGFRTNEITWLAELLWNYSQWVGSQQAFIDIFIAGGRGIRGFNRGSILTYGSDAGEALPVAAGDRIGGKFADIDWDTHVITIYDYYVRDSTWSSNRTRFQGNLAHECIHGLELAHPEVVGAFVAWQTSSSGTSNWQYGGRGLWGQNYQWVGALPPPVQYVPGKAFAYEIIANVAAYALIGPARSSQAYQQAQNSITAGWNTFIPNYVNLLYELQVTVGEPSH